MRGGNFTPNTKATPEERNAKWAKIDRIVAVAVVFLFFAGFIYAGFTMDRADKQHKEELCHNKYGGIGRTVYLNDAGCLVEYKGKMIPVELLGKI